MFRVQGAFREFQGNSSLLVTGKLITTENLHEMIQILGKYVGDSEQV